MSYSIFLSRRRLGFHKIRRISFVFSETTNIPTANTATVIIKPWNLNNNILHNISNIADVTRNNPIVFPQPTRPIDKNSIKIRKFPMYPRSSFIYARLPAWWTVSKYIASGSWHFFDVFLVIYPNICVPILNEYAVQETGIVRVKCLSTYFVNTSL
jgi:hypothetical protein